jgi:hypothetical protein
MVRSARPRRGLLGAGATMLALGCFGGVALAGHLGRITPVTSSHAGATRLARAMMANPHLLLSGRFVAIPPDHHPNAVSTARLAGFPRHGMQYAILTNGCATLADQHKGAGLPGCRDNGSKARGARDTTILRVTVHAPKGATCLSFRFRFLSQEYPMFVGSPYNDAFIAELDRSTWTTGPRGDRSNPHINAPGDFAKDSKGGVVSINSAGPVVMSKANARGTAYGGATNILRASTPITPGIHSLFLSIFDQDDRQYDSAAFIDQLTIDHRSPCKSGLATTR